MSLSYTALRKYASYKTGVKCTREMLCWSYIKQGLLFQDFPEQVHIVNIQKGRVKIVFPHLHSHRHHRPGARHRAALPQETGAHPISLLKV